MFGIKQIVSVVVVNLQVGNVSAEFTVGNLTRAEFEMSDLIIESRGQVRSVNQ